LRSATEKIETDFFEAMGLYFYHNLR
jgi:hypothetical protein